MSFIREFKHASAQTCNVINRFFMKLFKTNNLETDTYCRMQIIFFIC